MKYFNVGRYDDYKSLNCNNEDIKDWVKQGSGIHGVENISFRIHFDKTQKQLIRFADFVYFTGEIWGVSEKAKSQLFAIMDPSGKWIPSHGLNDFYSLFFFDKIYDCMDVKKSEIDVVTQSGWGRIRKIAIDTDKMPQLDIFEFKNICMHTVWSSIIVSERFVKISEKNGLTGWFYEEVLLV